MTAILLYTYDKLVFILEALLTSEVAIENRFGCRDRKLLAKGFKGMDFTQDKAKIALSQIEYLDTNGKTTPTDKTFQRYISAFSLTEYFKNLSANIHK